MNVSMNDHSKGIKILDRMTRNIKKIPSITNLNHVEDIENALNK